MTMRLPLRLLALLLSAGLLGGCATLFSGTDEDITFRSEPEGARVLIGGIVVGTTPTTVEVDRPGLDDTDVTIELDGYDPRTFELDKEFNTVSILNIFFWPGFVVDALTGALFRYDRTTYTVDLEEGTVSMNLEDLRRSKDGHYLLPPLDQPITVVDRQTGLVVTFN